MWNIERTSIEPSTSEDSGPAHLTITVAVTDPEDLKVEQGDRVETGQLIAESPSVRLRQRTRERERLEAPQAKLQLALVRLERVLISSPLPPATAPPILEPTYLEEDAEIARAAVTVDQAENERIWLFSIILKIPVESFGGMLAVLDFFPV